MSRLRLSFRSLLACCSVALALLPVAPVAAGPRTPPAAAAPAQVLTLSLRGVVDPFMASYVQRGLAHAQREAFRAVALTIDTPGGLDSSMRDIVRAVLASPVPVICYVPPGGRAASAGTFIMFACPVAGMAPGSSIGAAHPVGVSGAVEQAKVTNDAAAFIRSLAARQGRNADWAERAVRDSISADALAAQQQHIVDFVAPGLAALLADAALFPDAGGPPGAFSPGTEVRFPMSPLEGFFHAFADPTVAFILVDIAFVALLIWALHPGFHLPLAVGIIGLTLGLAILETLPVRLAGVTLLAVASVLFVLDVHARAHGVLTAGGIAVFVVGGLLLFNPAVPAARVALPVLISIPVGLGVFSAITVRALLSTRHQPILAGAETLPGSVGVTETTLDPAGRVRVQGRSWAAVSLAGPLPEGVPVRVVARSGLKLQVQPVPVPTGPGPL